MHKLAALLLSVFLTIPLAAAAVSANYIVRPGDTLSEIAYGHGMSTAALARANGISNTDFIRIGQRLIIPNQVYVVRAGDALSVIAVRFQVRMADIMAANGIINPNLIRSGQRLTIPSGGVTPTTNTGTYPNLPSIIRNTPSRLALIPSFERWSDHYDVPVDLVMAHAFQESGWRQSARSPIGAVGVGQLMPPTSRWIARNLIGIPELDPRVADDNIRMSVRYLKFLRDLFPRNERYSIGSYYQGQGATQKYGLFDETVPYVNAVQDLRRLFR